MSQTAKLPNTLLVHDGELDDLRALFGELGAPFVERRDRLLTEDREEQWGLVVATPRRLLGLHLNPSGSVSGPVQIAIADDDSRTLRNSLRRAGIRLMVRRPVHPAALRALVLHSLYRGPEKRRNARVSVGAPIRIRVGWRQRAAVLTDLSVGGCRLLSHHELERGQGITVLLPADLTGGRAFSVRARVLRITRPAGDAGQIVTTKFEKVSKRLHERLKGAIEQHATGPAVFDDGPNQFDDETIAVTGAIESVNEVLDPPATPSEAAHPKSEPRIESDTGAEADSSEEDRRNRPRLPLDSRVIALGQEATRVLMGRDISTGGMRVSPNPLLRLGEDFQLAIHVADEASPVVVRAKVHRDDGDDGVVLRFHELSTEAARVLTGIVENIPLLDPEDGEDDAGLVMSEILLEDGGQQVSV